jgi:hypothetical protein
MPKIYLKSVIRTDASHGRGGPEFQIRNESKWFRM